MGAILCAAESRGRASTPVTSRALSALGTKHKNASISQPSRRDVATCNECKVFFPLLYVQYTNMPVCMQDEPAVIIRPPALSSVNSRRARVTQSPLGACRLRSELCSVRISC